MPANVDIKELLVAGAHFGHKTSRWHPKMAPYVHSKRDGAHIINLEKTVEALEAALPEITRVSAAGKKILFVGTKKQMKDIVKEAALAVDMPFVTARWIGGMLTNIDTMSKQIRKLKELERRMATGELERRYTKLDVQHYQEEIDLLNERYGGIKDMNEQPAMLIVADMLIDKNAIKEAATLNIPVVAIADSNADPSKVAFPIPANDDSIKATRCLFAYFVDAVKAGQAKRKTLQSSETAKSTNTKKEEK